MNERALCALASLAMACGSPPPVASPPPASGVPVAPQVPVATQPDVDLREPGVATVRGQRVAFDGIAEGLAWPSLAKALGGAAAVTIQVARGEPTIDLLRAAWTLQHADVRVQTPDETGVVRAVELRARPQAATQAAPGREGAAAPGACHLAVFLRPDGSLRVAAPGGPREITGEHAADDLARSLEAERARCAIKYIAFGAESDGAPWGPVFDMMAAVDRARSAGDARFVLGQAMHMKR